MNAISRETFEGMDSDSKLNVLFDLAFDSHERTKNLEKKINRNRKIDTVFSGTMGFFGGFAAFISQSIFWRK